MAKATSSPIYTGKAKAKWWLPSQHVGGSYLVPIRLDLVHQGCKLAEIGISIHNHKGKEELPDWFPFSLIIAETGIERRSKQSYHGNSEGGDAQGAMDRAGGHATGMYCPPPR